MLGRLIVVGVMLSCTHPSAPVPVQTPPVRSTATPPPPVVDAAPSKIGLALTVTPPDAEVLIDGVSYGKASTLDKVVELKPGLYTLMVARSGYVSYRVEFSVADKTESFVVHLEPAKP